MKRYFFRQSRREFGAPDAPGQLVSRRLLSDTGIFYNSLCDDEQKHFFSFGEWEEKKNDVIKKLLSCDGDVNPEQVGFFSILIRALSLVYHKKKKNLWPRVGPPAGL